MLPPRDMTLFIDPFSHHFERDRLFDPATEKFNGEDILAPWLYLRDWFTQRGVAVHTADRLVRGEVHNKKNVFVSFGLRKRCRAVAGRPDVILSAFFAFESPVVEPTLYSGLKHIQHYFKRIFTFSDTDSLRPFLRAPLQSQRFLLPTPLDAAREEFWRNRDRKFLVMINNNRLPAVYRNELYTERMRAVAFFARTGEIDLYGKYWDQPSTQMGIGWMPGTLQIIRHELLKQWQRLRPVPLLVAARRVYRGTVWSKLKALSQYTFSVCFENAILNGWVTEKIFDCLAAGNIPIYWGAPDIEKYVPSDCFIDMRRFSGYEELRSYLKSLSPDQIQEYREKGRAYFHSPQFQPFTKQAFTDLLARVISEDTGVQW